MLTLNCPVSMLICISQVITVEPLQKEMEKVKRRLGHERPLS